LGAYFTDQHRIAFKGPNLSAIWDCPFQSDFRWWKAELPAIPNGCSGLMMGRSFVDCWKDGWDR
jgi:hypothetical protein